MFDELAFVGGRQYEELAPVLSNAADFRPAELEAGFVNTKIVADQLAFPTIQEVTSMLTCPPVAESVYNSSCFAELVGGVRPNIRAVGFLQVRSELLYRSFFRVHDLLPGHNATQGMY